MIQERTFVSKTKIDVISMVGNLIATSLSCHCQPPVVSPGHTPRPPTSFPNGDVIGDTAHGRSLWREVHLERSLRGRRRLTGPDR